ncbi:type IIL restriction-modification enzyme MmeI [Chenggangzhangella methanolivorans]|uniref:type IIL restriction-modification enzyme MmeI n=1 Tax=Chenggangzhangella methanolivorans TaxID=1437009 RepID=UPI0021BDDFD4|nr:type IIL restriction-modification enzyme MmeI [Chenggangzhangella methanolivorans]
MSAEHFIARWSGREGGAERANYQMFLAELCDVLGSRGRTWPGPRPRATTTRFERAVRPRETDAGGPKRIDLYKRGCFILEAKQSRLKGAGKAPRRAAGPPARDGWPPRPSTTCSCSTPTTRPRPS